MLNLSILETLKGRTKNERKNLLDLHSHELTQCESNIGCIENLKRQMNGIVVALKADILLIEGSYVSDSTTVNDEIGKINDKIENIGEKIIDVESLNESEVSRKSGINNWISIYESYYNPDGSEKVLP